MTPATSDTLPSFTAPRTMAADFSRSFSRSTVSRSVFGSASSSVAASTLAPFTSTACEAMSCPGPERSFSRRRASSFCRFLFSSCSDTARFLSCSKSTLWKPNTPANSAIACSRPCTQASAPSPVVASTRRTPAAMPDCSTILKKPMSPVRATWVPPQNSRELPISSTRTSSPYFSPKSMTAPDFFACSIGMISARVGVLRTISAFTCASMRRISSSVSGLSCEKSKRVFSPSTSDPFCCTCGPSTSRSALCMRCVTE